MLSNLLAFSNILARCCASVTLVVSKLVKFILVIEEQSASIYAILVTLEVSQAVKSKFASFSHPINIPYKPLRGTLTPLTVAVSE